VRRIRGLGARISREGLASDTGLASPAAPLEIEREQDDRQNAAYDPDGFGVHGFLPPVGSLAGLPSRIPRNQRG